MSERRELPRVISATHRRYRTPHVSILLTSVICLALTLSSTFSRQVNLSVIARLISYSATCAALLVFRRSRSAPPALFKATAGVPAAIAALLLVIWLLTNSTFYDARDSVIAASAGLIIYFGYPLFRKVVDARERTTDKDIVRETHN
jgi:APA family basic amino acid/polyamine antiporter